MENVALEIKEHGINDELKQDSKVNHIQYREMILKERKRVCERIFQIEMKYEHVSVDEQKRLDRELMKCGNELIKLVPPRKTVQLLYG